MDAIDCFYREAKLYSLLYFVYILSYNLILLSERSYLDYGKNSEQINDKSYVVIAHDLSFILCNRTKTIIHAM